MHFDHSLIGKSSAPQTFEVTLEAVRLFMEATGDPALQSKETLQYAPPTFPTTFRIRVPDLHLDPTTMQLLHGEQQYTYTRQLRIGEQVTCVAHIADVRERHGKAGTMAFIITETIGTDSQHQPVYTARSTLIVRQK
ncbi:MAG TPA: MaoC family dehydratase N-terminal domain-containing protein [Ktedonobacteraceae bacterium]|nr:MaoC family dehydratase N-terminal domain-containing protein [Ktedonobacteraceae bacterium]